MDQLNQNLSDFLSTSGSGSAGRRTDTAPSGPLSSNLSGLVNDAPATVPKGSTSVASPIPAPAIDAIAEREGLSSVQRAVMGALLGQESNNGQNAATSVDGARGAGQIMPDTFRRFAKASERIDNQSDNLAVMARIVRDLGTKFNDDPARIAAGYFSGDGNVNSGAGSAWKIDKRDGNGKQVSSYVADVLKRIGNAVLPPAEAAASPAPAAPDLSKAPRWADVVQKPEFQGLSDADKAQAKQAYFDYWIAPHVAADQRPSLRQQFMVKKDETPGVISRAANAVKSLFNTQGEGAGAVDLMTGIDPAGRQSATGPAQPPEDPAMQGSVMSNVPPAAPGKTATLPVDAAFRQHFNNAYDAATPDQRTAMERMPGIVGILAKERNEQAALPATSSLDSLDPRAEARARRLVGDGMDSSLVDSWAKTAAARGTAPGDEVGSATKSNFDFDAQKKFNEDPFWSNPVVRGAVKGVEGYKQGVIGINQAIADLVGADEVAAGHAKMAKESDNFVKAIGDGKTYGARMFEGAISSIAQQLPAMLGGAVTGSEALVLSSMFAQSFGQEYSNGRDQGQSGEKAALRAAQYAALEVIGEKFGLHENMAGIKAAAKGDVHAAITNFAHALAKEVPGEELTTVGQFGVDKEGHGVGLNTEAGVRDLVQQMADTFVQTVMQSGVMMAGGKVVGTAVNKLDTPERQIAREIQKAADSAQADPGAVDAAARAALNPENGNSQVIAPEQTRRPAAQPDSAPEAAGQKNQEPEPAVSPSPEVAATNTNDSSTVASDADVLAYAESRHEALLAKRDGQTEQVVGEDGKVHDVEQPGTGLSADEQAELDALERDVGNAAAIRRLYGLGASEPGQTKETVDAAAHEAATSPLNDTPEPTDAQKEAGNYKKGHINIQGLDIAIENPQGSQRSGVDPNGKAWSIDVQNHYGYIKRTEGADGDHVDAFIGPNPDSMKVFIVDQVSPQTAKFDEHKVMIGFNSKEEADAAYHANYEHGWKGRAAITELSMGQFKEWLAKGNTKTWYSKPKTEKEAKARKKEKATNVPESAQMEQKTPTEAAAQSAPVEKAGPKTEREVKAQSQAQERSADAQALITQAIKEKGLKPGNARAELFRDGILDAAAGKDPQQARMSYVEGFNWATDQLRKAKSTAKAKAEFESVMRKAEVDAEAERKISKSEREPGNSVKDQRATMPDRVVVGPSSLKTRPIDAVLYRETNIDGLDDMLRGAFTGGAVANVFMADNPDLAIGQGTNKGVIIQFRKGAVSGQEHLKPMTGATAGREYKSDFAGPDSIDQILVRDGKITRGITRRFLAQYFHSHKLEGGGTLYTRIGEQFDQRLSDRTPLMVPKSKTEKEMKARKAAAKQAEMESAASVRQSAQQAVSPITDFGEKIGGAKKDIWTGFKDDLNAVSDDEIGSQPLSKVWPAPDYQKLIDGGMDSEAVSAVRALRDEIPSKPRASWKVKRWAEQVKTLRDFANDVMDGKLPAAKLRAEMNRAGTILRGVNGRIDLYMEVGHAKSLEGIRFQEHHYSLYKGQENVNLWAVEKDATATAFSNWPQEIATGKTKEEAIANFKAKYDSLNTEKVAKQPSFDIFSEHGVDGYFVGKKIGRNIAALAGPFKTVKETRQYRDDHLTELQDKLEKVKEIPHERRDVNNPRVGEDMRNGQDVTPEMFADTFGFRGVEFGNWVEQGRRQQDLNDAFDALMDMAAILGIPPKAISLNGELGLAFGARGNGGVNPASAHYERGKVVINLTKRNGAGSLGHEWWHALDNYFSRMRAKGDDMMTSALDVSLASRGANFEHRGEVRREMIQAFGEVVKSIRQTALKARSQKLDNKRTKEYWTTGPEMSARAFESYLISKLQDNNASNDYLANIVDEKTWKAAESLGFELDDSYPYPTAGEIPAIRAAFDKFFQTVESRESGGGKVALFSRGNSSEIDGSTIGEGVKLPVSGEVMDRVVEGIRDGFRKEFGTDASFRLQKVRTFEDLPAPILADAARQGVAPTAPGVFYGGTMYIVQENHRTAEDVEKTIFHELYGHAAIHTLFNRAYERELNTLLQRIGGWDGILPILKKYNIDLSDYVAGWEQDGTLTDSMRRAVLMDEVLAHIAEQGPSFRQKVREIWGAIRQWLRSHGFAELAKYNDADLAHLLKQARESLGVDQPVGGPIVFSRGKVQQDLIKEFGKPKFKNVDGWDKSVGTQLNKAMKEPHYRKVFDIAVDRENVISLASVRPAELAPGFLPRIDDFKSALKTLALGRKNDRQMQLATEALVAGTLQGQAVLDGKVWADDELRNQFGMDDTGVSHYRQARAAIDASLDEVAAAEGYALLQMSIPRVVRYEVISNPSQAESTLTKAINKRIAMEQLIYKKALDNGASQAKLDRMEAEIKRLMDVRDTMYDVFKKANALKEAGYTPLMRFGKYKVTVEEVDPHTGKTVVDEKTGEPHTLYFGRFETEGEAEAEYYRLSQLYRDQASISVKAGPVNDIQYRMYAGLSPETLALFAEEIGADQVMKTLYQVAVSERSALKRRLERKNIAGYSHDMPRVLANFITSNGRFAAQRYYTRDLNSAIKYIPRDKADVQKEAQKLKEFLDNPSDAGAGASSVAFVWFLGGNIASAAVNATQPVLMTGPYLSQWGAARATASLAKAVPYALGKKQIVDQDLRDALKRAAQEGKVDAQEIFHLYSVGIQGVVAGLTNKAAKIPLIGNKVKAGADDLRARMSALGTLWGMPFAMVEGFNRRLTFIAAWDIAKATKQEDPFAFAVRAVDETQGIYNKVNRPNWARSAPGRIIMTFSQYKIAYVELISRMWKYGGADGKKAAAFMMAVLILASGLNGLPYADDIDDLIDTVGQFFGRNTNMKRNKRQWAYETIGKFWGDLALYGISSKLPLDFSGRLGLGNMVPGTALLKPSDEASRNKQIAELFGPLAGIGSQIGDAYDAAAAGDTGKMLEAIAPTAIKNALAGLDMARTGEAKDYKGRKVMDVGLSDAAWKATGFNPTVIAENTRKTMPVRQDIALQQSVKSDIVEMWARGALEKKSDLVEQAKQKLTDWNKTNSDTPIAITSKQIVSRAKQMATERDNRTLKAAPREMRNALAQQLDE